MEKLTAKITTTAGPSLGNPGAHSTGSYEAAASGPVFERRTHPFLPLGPHPQQALFGAQASYPFLEVGSPLVIFADHDLNAAFPVLPFCGDGL